MKVTSINTAYFQLVDRRPTDFELQEQLNNKHTLNLFNLYRKISTLDEFKNKVWKYRFFSYAATFDPIQLILKFYQPDLKPIQNHLVNFLGVGFPHDSLPLPNPPDIEELPIPANWHTDLAELGSALHVVSECSREFSMIELGSGIGVWSNICGKAAKMRGLKTKVIGIEGDIKHLMVAAETLKLNNILPDEYQLIHGIVAPFAGRALFKKHPNSGIDWGRQPILNNQAELFAKALMSSDYEEVPVYNLDLLLNEIKNVDLLHVDIQGGEETLFDGQEVLLNDKVKNIIIGTHSRNIEGKLFDYFQRLGWSLEAERPLIGSIENEGLRTVVDGVQYWKNKKNK